MPEHDQPDIDAAFEALTRDVGSISRPQPTREIFRAANRRRGITVVVTAAAVAAAGAVAVQALPLGGDEPKFATDQTPEPLPLPEAANLSPEILDSATADWDTGWQTDDNPGSDGQDPVWFDCPETAFDQIGRTWEEHSVGYEDETFFRIDPERRLSVLTTTQTSPGVAADVLDDVIGVGNTCGGALADAGVVTEYDGAKASGFQLDYGTQRLAVWYVTAGAEDSVAILSIGSRPLPESTVREMNDALVADLLAPSSYEDGTITVG